MGRPNDPPTQRRHRQRRNTEWTTNEEPRTPTGHKWPVIVAAIAAPVAISLILVAFRDQLHAGSASLVLVLVVLAAALAGGRTPGLVAAASSAFCFDFFFTKPYYSLAIANRDDVETTVVLFIVGLAVGELVVRSRRVAALAESHERAAEYLRASAALAAGGAPKGYLIQAVQRELVALLGAKSASFEPPPLIGSLPALQHGRVSIPTAEDAFPLDVYDGHLVEIAVFGRGTLQGRFVVELPAGGSGLSIDPERRSQALALADQLGAALAG
jgi:K+-sensing histidine kinase KdpD